MAVHQFLMDFNYQNTSRLIIFYLIILLNFHPQTISLIIAIKLINLNIDFIIKFLLVLALKWLKFALLSPKTMANLKYQLFLYSQ